MSDKSKLEERDAEERLKKEDLDRPYSWADVILDDVLQYTKSDELKGIISK